MSFQRKEGGLQIELMVSDKMLNVAWLFTSFCIINVRELNLQKIYHFLRCLSTKHDNQSFDKIVYHFDCHLNINFMNQT